jgi:hypothetical protein
MLLAEDFRRHAHVCARLADDCDDPHLAERLGTMASDLLAKADDFEELHSDRCGCSAPSGRPRVDKAAQQISR